MTNKDNASRAPSSRPNAVSTSNRSGEGVWLERQGESQRARESDGMKWASFIGEGQPTNAAQLDTRSPVEGDRESGRENKRTIRLPT